MYNILKEIIDKLYLYRIPAVKTKITERITEEGNQWIGCGMTYSLFECLKENLTELLEEQPEQPISCSDISTEIDKLDVNDSTSKVTQKKEHLTKAQKRRQWVRSDHRGELPRGYDWVDIVKHLSQTGSKNDTDTA